MSYRLKLTVSISLLIAIAFGIGGTLMITTSFSSGLEQEAETALDKYKRLVFDNKTETMTKEKTYE